jgi:hypothetical protein
MPGIGRPFASTTTPAIDAGAAEGAGACLDIAGTNMQKSTTTTARR